MFEITEGFLVERLSLAQIDRLRVLKLEALAEQKAQEIERARELRRQLIEQERVAARAAAEIDGAVRDSAQDEDAAEALRLAISRQTFSGTPVYPVNQSGKPLPGSHPKVREFVRQAAQSAGEVR